MAGRLLRLNGSTDLQWAYNGGSSLRPDSTWGSVNNSFYGSIKLMIDAPGAGTGTIWSEYAAGVPTIEVFNNFGAIYIYLYRSDGNFRSYTTNLFTAIPHRQLVCLAWNYDATTDTMQISVNGTAFAVTAGSSAASTARNGGTTLKLGVGATVGRMAGWARDLTLVAGASLGALDWASFSGDPEAFLTAGSITPTRLFRGYLVATSAGSDILVQLGLTGTTATITGSASYSGVQYAWWESFWYSPVAGVTLAGVDVTAWADQIGPAGSMTDGSANKCHLLTSPSTHVCAPGHSDLFSGTGTNGVGANSRKLTFVGVLANPYRRALRGGIDQVGAFEVGYGSSGTSLFVLAYDNKNAIKVLALDNSNVIVETRTPLDSLGRPLIMPASRFRFGVTLGPAGISVCIGSQVGTASAFAASTTNGSGVGLSPTIATGTSHKTNIDIYGVRGGHFTLTTVELQAYMAAADPDNVATDPLGARAMLAISGMSIPGGFDGSIATPATHDNKGWAKYLEADPGLRGVVMYNWTYGGSNIYDLGGTTYFGEEVGNASLLAQLAQIGKDRRFCLAMDGSNSLTETCTASLEYANSRAVGVALKALYGKVLKVSETPRTNAPNYDTTPRQDKMLAFNAAHRADIPNVWDRYIDIEALSAFHVAAGYSSITDVEVITHNATVYSFAIGDVVHWRHTAGGGHPIALAKILLEVLAAFQSSGIGRVSRIGRINRINRL